MAAASPHSNPPVAPPLPPHASPEPRYAALRQNLEWLRIAALVILGLSLFAGLIIALDGLASRAERVAALSIGLTYIVVGIVGYLWTMVAIGVARVIIDLEANTRSK